MTRIETCGQVCGIPKADHQTEEHPWVAESPLKDAALAAYWAWIERDSETRNHMETLYRVAHQIETER